MSTIGAAAPLLDHQRCRGLDGVPDADEVDVELVAEGAARVGGGVHDPDAGVGEDDVDPAQLPRAVGDRPRDGVGVADVDLGR